MRLPLISSILVIASCSGAASAGGKGKLTSEEQCIEHVRKCPDDASICFQGACLPRLQLHSGACRTSDQCPQFASCLPTLDTTDYRCSCPRGLKELRGGCHALNSCVTESDCRSGQRCVFSSCEFANGYVEETSVDGSAFLWITAAALLACGVLTYVLLKIAQRFTSYNLACSVEDGTREADQVDQEGDDSRSRRRQQPITPSVVFNTGTNDGGNSSRSSQASTTASQGGYQRVSTSDAPPPFDPPPAYEDVGKSSVVHFC